jgi:hypothetical protein
MNTKLYMMIDNRVFSIYSDPNFGWDYVNPLHFSSGQHNITWAFKISSQYSLLGSLPQAEAEAWLDEIRICQYISNYPPHINSFLPDKASPQEANEIINWTVEAEDMENDPLEYQFFLNNNSTTNWTTQNRWTWRTSLSDVGQNSIKVWIKDGKRPIPNGYDNCSLRSFTTLTPRE